MNFLSGAGYAMWSCWQTPQSLRKEEVQLFDLALIPIDQKSERGASHNCSQQ